MQLTRTTIAVAAALAPLIGFRIGAGRSSQPQGPGSNHAVGYYDPSLQRAVLISGANRARVADRDRVWSWNGSRWDIVTDSGPPARGNAGVAFDEKRRVAVVTGGARRAANDSTIEIIADTWEGHASGWRRMAGDDEIAPRDHNSLVYDPQRGTVLMFGGILADRSAPWPSDTWELGTGGWARVGTEGPPGRGRTALAFDSKRGQVVLFGGAGAPGPNGAQPFFGDTWVWERGQWRKVAEDGPRGRYAHGMVYDEGAGVVLLYSGAAAHRDAPLTDMWQWDGTRWTEIRLTGQTPGFRYQPVMVYDKARRRTILFGGYQGPANDTWEWDGQSWKQIAP